MTASARELWQRYQTTCSTGAGVNLDSSRMDFPSGFFEAMATKVNAAFDAMQALEEGAVANSDQGWQVGHYWLRSPDLAPKGAYKSEIESELARVKRFATLVRTGEVRPPSAEAFSHCLVIGIGGSALGPQLLADALGDGPGGQTPSGTLTLAFLDNTDPDGISRTLGGLDLKRTLTLVVSKSGGTKETRNGMLEAKAAYERAGLDFARHAAAVTSSGSELDRRATDADWLERFAMWDWIGGRTSVFSAVGLLPAALQGLDIDGLLEGAAEMDAATRVRDLPGDASGGNIAMRLALSWYHATAGHGTRAMVVIPYKDRLQLLSRYLQQLVMESLGKRLDLDGNTVHQGITVFGNKGSTDQHSYIQQLRDGIHNFFATFVEVLQDREGDSIHVEKEITSGDYLAGFLLGTREALYESDRESITLTVDRVSANTLGALIALYERAVGFYASLIHINAYHQPGVEAGKKAAERVIRLQRQAVAKLKAAGADGATADELAAALGNPEDAETIYKVLLHLTANGRGIQKDGDSTSAAPQAPAATRFRHD